MNIQNNAKYIKQKTEIYCCIHKRKKISVNEYFQQYMYIYIYICISFLQAHWVRMILFNLNEKAEEGKGIYTEMELQLQGWTLFYTTMVFLLWSTFYYFSGRGSSVFPKVSCFLRHGNFLNSLGLWVFEALRVNMPLGIEWTQGAEWIMGELWSRSSLQKWLSMDWILYHYMGNIRFLLNQAGSRVVWILLFSTLICLAFLPHGDLHIDMK